MKVLYPDGITEHTDQDSFSDLNCKKNVFITYFKKLIFQANLDANAIQPKIVKLIERRITTMIRLISSMLLHIIYYMYQLREDFMK